MTATPGLPGRTVGYPAWVAFTAGGLVAFFALVALALILSGAWS